MHPAWIDTFVTQLQLASASEDPVADIILKLFDLVTVEYPLATEKDLRYTLIATAPNQIEITKTSIRQLELTPADNRMDLMIQLNSLFYGRNLRFD